MIPSALVFTIQEVGRVQISRNTLQLIWLLLALTEETFVINQSAELFTKIISQSDASILI